jgi:tripartite-type tricarboxylate transporter receptor subunit TctC
MVDNHMTHSHARILLKAFFIVAALAMSFCFHAAAYAEYPERQITFIVCFPAGGSTDIAARLVSSPLGEELGQSVIVENRSGAGGNIGILAVARAAPDGYTLLVTSSAFVVNPSLYQHAGYDPFKDFVPIMGIATSPNVFVVPAHSDVHAISDLISKAKANPGKLNWASPGVGTTPYLAGELLKLRAGIDMVHVPFRGAGPASIAAVAGQVDMYAASLGSVMALINSGEVRPIAVTSKQRWLDIPNVPTLEEVGIANAVSDTFQAIYAPARTSRGIEDRLVKALRSLLGRPDIREKFGQVGLSVTAEDPEALKARIVREVPMYKEIIETMGLEIK